MRYALAFAAAVGAALLGAVGLGLSWLSWPGAVAGGVIIGVVAGALALALWSPER